MRLFTSKTRRERQAAGRKNKQRTDVKIAVSREDRGYDPYDTAPRDTSTRRRRRDRWSF